MTIYPHFKSCLVLLSIEQNVSLDVFASLGCNLMQLTNLNLTLNHASSLVTRRIKMPINVMNLSQKRYSSFIMFGLWSLPFHVPHICYHLLLCMFYGMVYQVLSLISHFHCHLCEAICYHFLLYVFYEMLYQVLSLISHFHFCHLWEGLRIRLTFIIPKEL